MLNLEQQQHQPVPAANRTSDMEKSNKLKLDRIKDSWYHSSPSRLYDLCIRVLVRNVNLIVERNVNPQTTAVMVPDTKSAKRRGRNKKKHNNHHYRNHHQGQGQRQRQHHHQPKYKLRECVGPLPSIICESLIKEYFRYYLSCLAKLERDEYFNNEATATAQNELVRSRKTKLVRPVTYYDVLMAFVCTPDKCCLDNVDYRQCMWSTSTLENRLKQKLEAQLKTRSHKVRTAYFKITRSKDLASTSARRPVTYLPISSSSRSGTSSSSSAASSTWSLSSLDHDDDSAEFKLKSLRGRQRAHLTDRDVKSIVKSQKKISYLDVCPCQLTNRTILLMNRHLNNHLKYLRLQNCCNWHSNSLHQQHHHNNHNHEQQQQNNFMFDETNEPPAHNNNYYFVNNNDLPPDNNNQPDEEDDDNFDAYLQEYVSRYEQQQQQQRLSTSLQQQQKKSSRRRRHKRRRHDRHKHKKKLKNELMLVDGTKNNANATGGDTPTCKLFAPESQSTTGGLVTGTVAGLKRKHRSSSRRCKPRRRRGDVESGKLAENQAASTVSKTETSSILKWLVKRAIMNTTSTGMSTVYSTGANNENDDSLKKTQPPAQQSQPPVSLLEQIKQKASFLADTKMIDKVSISSSNYDDYDLNNLNNNTNHPSSNRTADTDSRLSVLEDEGSIGSGSGSIAQQPDSISIGSVDAAAAKPASLLSSSLSSSLLSLSLLSTSDESSSYTTTSNYDDDDYYDDDDDEYDSSDEDDDQQSYTTTTGSSLYSFDSSGGSDKDAGSHGRDTTLLDEADERAAASLLEKRYLKQRSRSLNKKIRKLNEKIHSRQQATATTGNDDDDERLIGNKKVIRQQRLLEKVANLGSSPINVIQAIAAKALNFKLKNSISPNGQQQQQQMLVSAENPGDDDDYSSTSSSSLSSSQSSLTSTSESSSSSSSNSSNSSFRDYINENFKLPNFFFTDTVEAPPSTSSSKGKRRLVRRIKFLKSTNIKKSTSNQLINELIQSLNEDDEAKSKRSKEEGDAATTATGESKPGTSKSFEQHQQPPTKPQQSQQINSGNLFSVLKYWMSKKVDPNVSSNVSMSGEVTATGETPPNRAAPVEDATGRPPLPPAAVDDERKTCSHRHRRHRHHAQTNSSHVKRANTGAIVERRGMLVPLQQPAPGRVLVQTINLSKLQHLSLRNLGNCVLTRSILNNLLKNFKCLKYLDISNCCTNQLYITRPKSDMNQSDVEPATASSSSPSNDLIGCLDGLLCLAPTLTHLLFADLNVNDIQANLRFILKLKNLRHLDVSNCREKPPLNRYKNPSLLLAKLVYHLTKLTSLDISGTNLTGMTIFKEQDEIDYIKKRLYDDLTDECNDYQRVKLDQINTVKSGVSGLLFINNENKMLDFFGCFCCDNSISARGNTIPAMKIASESSEAYLYTSLEVYLNDRPLFLLDALNHLFELYRDEFIEDKLLGGHLIMDTMEKHLDNSRIQISGSASLFYVLKYWKEENFHLPPFYLKRLILTVINGMEEHIDESAMRRNCVLIMCRLNLPDDVLFVSDRLILILLKIFEDYIDERNKNPNDRPEHFVLRTAMHLLNILACSVHGNDKSKVGALSIPVAMNLIRTKTKFKEADDILEVTWSFLWNITDETPENCQIFLDKCDGMNAFMECIQFKKSEIIRNMMGLLGNVAEVKNLRNRLCKSDLISTFRHLLFQTNDGIEIPYNSAGVLVHIMSDGPEAWHAACDLITSHSRQDVIEDIETAIDKWDIQSERNINYRSFEPIFRLVEQFNNPICQRWSCWALANLTTVYPDTYCPLFEREHGRELLTRVLDDPNVNEAIKKYANIVMKNVNTFKNGSN